MVKMAERAHQLPLHVGAQGYRAEMAVSRAQKHQWLNSLRDARFVLDALRHQTSNAPRPNYFTKSTQAGMWQLQPPRRHDSPTTLLRHPSRLVVGVRSQRSPTPSSSAASTTTRSADLLCRQTSVSAHNSARFPTRMTSSWLNRRSTNIVRLALVRKIRARLSTAFHVVP